MMIFFTKYDSTSLEGEMVLGDWVSLMLAVDEGAICTLHRVEDGPDWRFAYHELVHEEPYAYGKDIDEDLPW